MENQLQYKRILCTEDPLFASCWALYQEAFPLNERRTYNYQQRTLQHPNYHHCAVMDGDNFIGILLWWDFDGWFYIEHLATLPSLRGRGYGEKILEDIKTQTTKPIILEVEIPTCEIQHRRIKFYSRVGFKLSPLEYSHPPYSLDSNAPVELQIMSYPDEISPKGLTQFKQHLPEIHFIT